jgi:hypothetical protein
MSNLAKVEKILSITPIEKADRIELVTVKGWQVVCKKGQYKVDDLVVYIEVDGLVPENILKAAGLWDITKDRGMLDGTNHNRVKTRRFLGNLSQGIVVPTSVLPASYKFKEGDDVSASIGITKYDPQTQEEYNALSKQSKSKTLKFLMGFKWCRIIYLKLNSKEKGAWPTGAPPKTDEDPIQNAYNIISSHFNESFYVSEKHEGQSFLAYTSTTKKWGLSFRKFGVCSRNVELKNEDTSNYWRISRRYSLKRILLNEKNMYSINGEICGPNIQGNIYNLNDIELFVFNVIKNGNRVGVDEMCEFCIKHGLKTVSILDKKFIPSVNIPVNDKETIVKWLLDYSNGKSKIYNTDREGVVLRLNSDSNISVKVRSPEYLLTHDT